MSLSIGDYTGGITHIRGSLGWFFTRHVGAGVGITSTDIRFEQKTGDTRLYLDYRDTAVAVFLDLVF